MFFLAGAKTCSSWCAQRTLVVNATSAVHQVLRRYHQRFLPSMNIHRKMTSGKNIQLRTMGTKSLIPGDLNLTVPTLLINEHICRSNVQDMLSRSKSNGVELRPHFKTHQSRYIGNWFHEEGISRITVSSLGMAAYFYSNTSRGDASWNDITVAFPFNMHEITVVKKLLLQSKNKSDVIRLGLTVENEESIDFLAKHIVTLQPEQKLRLWIKVDTGYHRTGILHNDACQIQKLLDKISHHSTHLEAAGILIHPGHSYAVQGERDELDSIHKETVDAVQELRLRLNTSNNLEYSIGDTPCCSTQDGYYRGVSEIRPGNFAFYDVMQHSIGSIEDFNKIAVCLACPVVAKHQSRNQIVVYGGAVHLSLDSIEDPVDGRKIYGLPVSFTENGWGDPWLKSRVIKLSQEHGIIEVMDDKTFNNIHIGDWVGILPIHSCLTADVMGEYVTLEGKVIDHFRSHQISLSQK